MRNENSTNKIARNYSRKSLKYKFFVFINFPQTFREYLRMETQAIRMRMLREKYLKNMPNNQSLRAKKYFIELKHIELKDKEEKIKERDYHAQRWYG